MQFMGFYILDIPGKPHRRKVSPTQFTDYVIFSIIKVSYFNVMVATWMKGIETVTLQFNTNNIRQIFALLFKMFDTEDRH